MKALLTIDHGEANPRYLVTPKISGTPMPMLLVDGVGTASLIPYFVRVTINPGDDVTAASRLKAGYPDVITIFPGKESPEFDLSSAVDANGNPVNITDLYLIAVGNTSAGPTTAAPANYTGNAYIVAATETDDSDWLAQMVHLTMDSGDKARRAKIKVSDVIASNYVYVNVEEVASYA